VQARKVTQRGRCPMLFLFFSIHMGDIRNTPRFSGGTTAIHSQFTLNQNTLLARPLSSRDKGLCKVVECSYHWLTCLSAREANDQSRTMQCHTGFYYTYVGISLVRVGG